MFSLTTDIQRFRLELLQTVQGGLSLWLADEGAWLENDMMYDVRFFFWIFFFFESFKLMCCYISFRCVSIF
jgi:hypothetical protein